MIQEIAPHSFCNVFCPRVPSADDLVLVFEGGKVLCEGGAEALRLPRCGDVSPLPEVHFAFELDGKPVFLCIHAPASLPSGFSMVQASALRNAVPQQLAWAVGVGGSLARWYQATSFCGCCGGAMADSQTERARICTRCGQTVYPKICPAVIVAVTDGDRLLLTRYQGRPFRSYALVAGFNEIGESLEDTVHREVWEETGLRVKQLQFYRSQPWVFTDSLLMGFFAQLDGSDVISRQESELAEAGWFSRDKLPQEHSTISLTGEMIELFRKGKAP